MPTKHSLPSFDLLEHFQPIVGTEHFLTDADQQMPNLHEMRGKYRGRAAAVVRPGSTAEVASVMKLERGAVHPEHKPYQ